MPCKQGQKEYAGILVDPTMIEMDNPEGGCRVVGFPRGERVVITFDTSMGNFVLKCDRDEVRAMVEEYVRK